MADPAKWSGHRRWSARIVFRRCGNALAYALAEFPCLAMAPTLERNWRSTYDSRRSYHAARTRLLKQGVVAEVTRDGQIVLELTPAAEAALPVWLRPEREWRRKWSGAWYIVSYDVPELRRVHRDVLRTLLQQHRFGQLHKSMWIGPWDIRPFFDDLRTAGGIADYAVLLEARSVMGGVPDEQIVRKAWPWQTIIDAQQTYFREIGDLVRIWKAAEPTAEEVRAKVRTEAVAYAMAMEKDPLLPRRLWPVGYGGERVYQLHREFCALASRRMA